MTSHDQPIRQADLARQLKLTQSTVSRALRGYDGISARLRKRILTAARDAGYELPRAAGGVAAARRTGVICADIPRTNEWQERLLDGMIAAARDIGCEIIVSAHANQDLPQVVARGQVDGLVRLMFQADFANPLLAAAPVPTASILFPVPGADVISVDHFGSARELGLHLGKQRPGIAAAVAYFMPIGRARFAGVRAGFEECAGAVPPRLTRVIDTLEPDLVMPLVDELLNLRAAGRKTDQFSLITFYNDDLAWKAVERIRARGLRVPEDIGVAGYDDVSGTRARDLTLATVHLPLEALGAAAVRRVQWRLDHPGEPPIHMLLDAPLVQGNSVRQP